MTKKDIAEFYAALAMLAKEKGIEVDYLLERISAAIVVAVKKDFGGDDNIFVNMDPETSEFSVVIRKEVVDEVENPDLQLTLEQAQQYNKRARVGKTIDIKLGICITHAIYQHWRW